MNKYRRSDRIILDKVIILGLIILILDIILVKLEKDEK